MPHSSHLCLPPRAAPGLSGATWSNVSPTVARFSATCLADAIAHLIQSVNCVQVEMLCSSNWIWVGNYYSQSIHLIPLLPFSFIRRFVCSYPSCFKIKPVLSLAQVRGRYLMKPSNVFDQSVQEPLVEVCCYSGLCISFH